MPEGPARPSVLDAEDVIAAAFRSLPGEERLGDATPGEIAEQVLAALTEAGYWVVPLVGLTPRGCFCGEPDNRNSVHRAHACTPWVTRQNDQEQTR